MTTRSVPASWLHVGSVVLESIDHPAVVTRIARRGHKTVRVWCRYTWQRPNETEWPLGQFGPNDLIELATSTVAITF
jgi:hypothetical protein